MFFEANNAVTEGDTRSNAHLAFRHTTKEDRDIFRGAGVKFNGNVEETLEEIGLNWKPETSMNRYGGIFEHVEDFDKTMYRPGDGQYMGTVPADWHTDEHSFAGVIDTFKTFTDGAGIELETVGKVQRLVTKRGCKTSRLDLTLYATASINGSSQFTLPGNDAVTGKLILRFPYSYGQGCSVALLSDRLVCTNGMVLTVKTGSKIIQHNSNFTLDKITQTLEGAKNCWGRYQEEAQLLSETVMPKDVAVMKIIEQFGDVTRPATDQPKVVQHLIDRWNAGGFKGSEMLSSFNTAWGLLNLVTEYCNHDRPRRSDSNAFVGQLIDTTSSLNRTQEQFMKSISSFAHAERTRQYGASTVSQSVRGF